MSTPSTTRLLANHEAALRANLADAIADATYNDQPSICNRLVRAELIRRIG